MHTIRIAIATAALLASSAAGAHAVLKHSDPAAGATLAAPPAQVALTFNEALEPAFSTVTLLDAAGKSAVAGKAQVDATQPAVVRLATPALRSGAYTVQWAVAGRDGHRRTGSFTFTVR